VSCFFFFAEQSNTYTCQRYEKALFLRVSIGYLICIGYIKYSRLLLLLDKTLRTHRHAKHCARVFNVFNVHNERVPIYVYRGR